MITNNQEEQKLRLSTLDCNTSTKYYQLTQTLTKQEKIKIKSYFKYYTPENFENIENVAGKTTGWLCKSDDVQKVEKILEIRDTKEKQNSEFSNIQQKHANNTKNTMKKLEISFSK